MTVATGIEAATTLAVIALNWHFWVAVTLVYAWLPGVSDMAFVFLISAAEVYLAATIGPDATCWFAAMALMYLAQIAGGIFVRRSARAEGVNRGRVPTGKAGWRLNVALLVAGCTSTLLFLLTSGELLDTSSSIGPAIALLFQLACIVDMERAARSLISNTAPPRQS
jgi:hypothetical protein